MLRNEKKGDDTRDERFINRSRSEFLIFQCMFMERFMARFIFLSCWLHVSDDSDDSDESDEQRVKCRFSSNNNGNSKNTTPTSHQWTLNGEKKHDRRPKKNNALRSNESQFSDLMMKTTWRQKNNAMLNWIYVFAYSFPIWHFHQFSRGFSCAFVLDKAILVQDASSLHHYFVNLQKLK